ncbi:MAG: ArnT family glycosyltransferase [Dehalococcoidia bacterium]
MTLVLPRLKQHAGSLTLLAAVALGLLVRGRYTFAANFPLNDGVLFYLMTQELQRAHYALPAFTSYHSADIPLAYPPLAFYAAGLLADITRLDLLTVFRLLPLLVNLATIVAFYCFARTFFSSSLSAGSRSWRIALAASVLAFAVLPRGFVWMIMGGGLTRAFGFFFAVLALRSYYLLYTQGMRRDLVLATLYSALTMLSHLEAGYFLALSVIILLVQFGRNRRGVFASAAVALGTVVLIAPWWLTVIVRHGPGPFLNAAQTGGGILSAVFTLTLFDITGEPLFPVMAGLALLGAVVCWKNSRLFLPYWLVLTILLDPRAAPNYATLPLAMLIGICVADVLLPALARPYHERDLRTGPALRPEAATFLGTRPAMVLAILGFALYYATMSALFAAPKTLGALRADDRQAMQWVAQQTPPDSRFLVVTGIGVDSGNGVDLGVDKAIGWGGDRVSEWFPVLAERVSVATPQGYEWLGSIVRLQKDDHDAQICAEREATCLDRWAKDTGSTFTYLYLPKGRHNDDASDTPDTCCRELRASLRSDSAYTLAYDGPGASIFVRRGG